MVNIDHIKKAIRRKQKERLASYDPTVKQQEALSLYRQLFSAAVWKQAGSVAITMSMPEELATGPLIDQALSQGKKVLIPKIINKKMIFVEYDRNTPATPGSMGIIEPVSSIEYPKDQIDLIIVPGLAFTKKGERIGFGAGYYDRYLDGYKGMTIALALNRQLIDQLPTDKFDVIIQKVLAPEK